MYTLHYLCSFLRASANDLVTAETPAGWISVMDLTVYCVAQLFVSLRMTDQDKEDFMKRIIDWQQNGLDLDKRNCLVLNFGSDLKLNYPQIRKI